MTKINDVGPDANGWMPIETAPKDGTQILTFSPHGTVICEWLPAGYFREGDLARWFPIVSPTHWQPLPEPPVERSKSEWLLSMRLKTLLRKVRKQNRKLLRKVQKQNRKLTELSEDKMKAFKRRVDQKIAEIS